MGVHGITTFLQEQKLLPSTGGGGCGCSTRLFESWNPSMAFQVAAAAAAASPPLQVLPLNSKLLVDGNGLAYFLYQVAFARHVQSLVAASGAGRRTTTTTTTTSCPTVQSLAASTTSSSSLVSQALPTMMPLDLLRQVTVEFVTTLRHFRTVCYWDGPSRQQRFKTRTHFKRKTQEHNAWACLESYCRHGTLPMKSTEPLCHLSRYFPSPRLVTSVVRQVLTSSQQGTTTIEMISCQEEADVELARAASGDSTAYVLGQDSDFMFYKDIQYVPMNGMYIQQSQTTTTNIHVVCWTRHRLAQALGLQDSQMVELALLLGNDYVDPITLQIPSHFSTGTQDFKDVIHKKILHLQSQDDEYKVESKTKDGAIELDYVRALYNLQDVAAFSEDTDDDDSSSSSSNDPLEQVDEDLRVISFPKNLPLDLAVLSLSDMSVQAAVVRCLQAYIDEQRNRSTDDATPVVFQQEHLDAYQASILATTIPSHVLALKGNGGRPRWNHVQAAFIMDVCIARAIQSSWQWQRPLDAVMNHWKFHALLDSMLLGGDDDVEVNDDRNDGVVIPPTTPMVQEERPVLPIDEHQDTILETIQNQRVTIIHGETGCGKSSRVPIMILDAPSPEPALPKIKMFISQPRRIAAKALVERVRSCEPQHGDKFALRMGHGYREYESHKTQAWFVTTGYLTRLLANHPERFENVTHLIIDEVHERSVDTDILCLLCRRLLERNDKIRLVLMSATLATKLYKEYFNVPSDPIHVGVRRFPIQEFFVEDLWMQFKLPPYELQAAKAIQKECETKRCNSAPSQAELSKRFGLAARLTTIVGVPGSSVLIFVPGMNEIIAITEAIEKMYRPGIDYICYPIHSDVPFEEQMGAFDAPEPNEVKVIIATNAAESSVTLPAVDHVICLGLCRQIMYNEASHRQILLPCWISKASATQRAGRTGRLRPGNVYRLYTRKAYEQYMDEFEQGEMVRIPLDSVILMLKDMLHEQVKPVLMDCIEPPKMKTIDKSFESLHHWNFLTEPNDEAEITNLGTFVTALGIDLMLGSFIGLGIQFGVAAEAIEMAAVMSFPKTPFQISNPLFHDPAKFNEIGSNSYVAKCHFDANLYSEPLALMNALWDYHVAPNRSHFCSFYRLAHARMSQLYSTRNNLRKRVADFLGINEDKLQAASPPVHMPHYKLVILRVLKLWVFSETVVECVPTKLKTSIDGSVTIKVERKQNPVSRKELDQILQKERHPYRIIESRDVQGNGVVCDDQDTEFLLMESVETIQERLISYMCETGVDAFILKHGEHSFAYFKDGTDAKPSLRSAIHWVGAMGESKLLQAESNPDMKRRGVLERKCGMWKVVYSAETISATKGTSNSCLLFRRLYTGGSFDLESFLAQALGNGEITSLIGFDFCASNSKKRSKKKATNSMFQFYCKGDCGLISNRDLQDLLASHSAEILNTTTRCGQVIAFEKRQPRPLRFKGKGNEVMATGMTSEISSWNRPLLEDIPEAARLVSVLASGQRKGGHRLRFPVENSDDPEASVDVFLAQEETLVSRRWRRLGGDRQVWVQEDTVSASATSTTMPLFACCANALEVNGGSMKVEGMTLLPPNPLFILICHLAFGLLPETGPSKESRFQLLIRGMAWLKKRKDMPATVEAHRFDENEEIQRLENALDFHEDCKVMGEALVCFPERIKALCELFSGLDDYEISLPEAPDERALTTENLMEWQQERKARIQTPAPAPAKQNGRLDNMVLENGETQSSGETIGLSVKQTPQQATKVLPPSFTPTPKKSTTWHILRTFDETTQETARRLFATTLDSGTQVSATDFPSTNVLSLLFERLAETLSQGRTANGSSQELNFSVDLDSPCWEIIVYTDELGQLTYQAKFQSDAVPLTKLLNRSNKKLGLPKWMKKHSRPHTIQDAKACVPPGVPCAEPKVVFLSNHRPALAFDSIEVALRMEAAFYLERQFAVASNSIILHWFHHGLDQMVDILAKTFSPDVSSC